MFSLSLRSTLLTLCLSVASVIGAPSLSLKVTGPGTADGVDNLKVVATVINTGTDLLKLLRDPRGALSSSPTNTFIITDSTGATPAFSGIKVKYVPSTVIGLNISSGFVELAPGQSIEVEHDLSKAYNFTRTGEGVYNIEASNLFHYVDPVTNVATAIRADVDEVHTASISGTLAIARRSQLSKRISYNGCSSSRQSILVQAAAAATTYAANAHDYLVAHTSSTTRYVTWFGTYSSSRHDTVTTHYANMNANPYANYEYDCTCTDSTTYAYVYPDQWGYIYLCGVFWQTTLTGTDSQGGTLVHESSHFTNIGSTDDYAYGQTNAKALAKSNPSQAIENADSHEYFAENNPAQS